MRPGTVLLFVFSLMMAWLGYAVAARPVADGSDPPFADDVGSGSALAPLAPYSEVPRVCRNYSMINYLSSFPCTDKVFAEHNESAAAALGLLRRCDVFAYVASELAARHINRHLQGIFTYSGDYLLPDLTLNLISRRGTSSDSADATFSFERAIRLKETPIHGSIGPQSSELLRLSFAQLAMRFQITMITYGAQSPELSNRRYFSSLYRTTPTWTLVNLARVRLLTEFNWYRCAVLTSPDHLHTQVLHELVELEQLKDSDIELTVYDTFDETATYLLERAAEDDMRIFIVISDEIRTRNTLCEAHRNSHRKLTGPAYVWILPLFYDTHWWRLSQHQINNLRPTQRCSNYEMREILNTTHVLSVGLHHHLVPSLDTGWNQTVAITQTQFLETVQNLTLDYFPSLHGINLIPYLLRSQGASAYDAVWGLSRAWHTILPPLVHTHSIGSVEDPVDRRGIEARLLNQALNGTLSGSTTGYDPSYFMGVAGRHDFSKDVNVFGKVLASQYIEGTERPVGIYATRQTEGGHQLELGDLLQLTQAEDWLFEAPHDFVWLTGRVPSDGVEMRYSEVPTAGVLVVLVAVLLSVVFAAAIGIATVVYRNNKHIKASSPRLSVLVLLGLVLMMPYPLLLGLVNSSHSDTFLSPQLLSTLCSVGNIVPSSGEILAFAVLLVKNWRLYRIFYNDSLKPEMSRCLRDKYLVLLALLLVVPHLLLHTTWQLLNPFHYQETTYTVSPTESLTITYCNSTNLITWEFILISYFGALAFVLLFLSLQNHNIPAHFSHFSMEGNQSSISVLITLAIFVPGLMFMPCLDSDPRLYQHKFWTTALVSVALPDTLIGTLFLKKFVVIWRERKERVNVERQRSVLEQQRSHFADLGQQASRLKLELKEKEEKVMSLRERQLKDRSDSAISTASSAALLTTCPSSPSSDITCPIDGGGEGEDGGGVNYRNRLFFARTPSDLSPDQNRTLFNV